MRAVILGAGAIGGGLGALLSRGGMETVLVARGAHLEALKAGGRLRTPTSVEPLTLDASALEDLTPRDDDVLLFATKLPETQALIERLGRWGDAPAVSLQGGLVAEGWLGARFSRVIASVVYVPGNVMRPGELTLWGVPVPGRVVLGVAAGEAQAIAQRLVDAWEAGGLPANLHPDIWAAKRRKLWVNLAGLPWALTGEVEGPASDAARAECLAVFDAAELPVAPLEDIVVEGLALADIDGEQRPGPSLADSLRRGRRSEGHWTYGEIVRMGAELGVPTPVNARLLSLLRESEAAGAMPEGWTQQRLAQG